MFFFSFFPEIVTMTIDCNTIQYVFFFFLPILKPAYTPGFLFAETDCFAWLLALCVSWWSCLDAWCCMVISPQRHDQNDASL